MQNPPTNLPRRAGGDEARGIAVWMVLYAVFMVALFALGGGTGALPGQ
jgi:hypothetical protein